MDITEGVIQAQQFHGLVLDPPFFFNDRSSLKIAPQTRGMTRSVIFSENPSAFIDANCNTLGLLPVG